MQTVMYLMKERSMVFFSAVRITTVCITLALSACQKPEPETGKNQAPQKIELIQQDLIAFQNGSSVHKTAFTGTIRAVNRSSIQSQVSATASQVSAEVGQRVSKGEILVRLNNQDNAARLAQSRANLAAAQAQEKMALNMMQRKQRLLNQGFISRVEYEQSAVDYQAQKENTHAQQANVDIALKADRDGIILSPINGVVTVRQVEPGQTVATGQTLFEIIDPERTEIQAKLPSDLQSALRPGQKIEFSIQGNPALLSATLSRVSPVADLNSRQIEFFAVPDRAVQSLSIGAFVEGNILSATQVQGQIIPLDVIQNIDQQPFVWVIRNKRIEKQNIQVIEQRYSNNSAVVQGLILGDLISRVKFTDQDNHKEVAISPK